MKGFKHTGNGPCYGEFCFAKGGLAKGKAPEAPGFSDFKFGGQAKKGMTKKAMKEQEKRKALSKAAKLMRKARGGGVSDPMSSQEALRHAKGGLSQAVGKVPFVGKTLQEQLGSQYTEAEGRRYLEAQGRNQARARLEGGHGAFRRRPAISTTASPSGLKGKFE